MVQIKLPFTQQSSNFGVHPLESIPIFNVKKSLSFLDMDKVNRFNVQWKPCQIPINTHSIVIPILNY